jgi:hypothetical protein
MAQVIMKKEVIKGSNDFLNKANSVSLSSYSITFPSFPSCRLPSPLFPSPVSSPPRRRRVYNIKMDLREIGWSGMDWIDLAQDRGQGGGALVNTVINLRVP